MDKREFRFSAIFKKCFPQIMYQNLVFTYHIISKDKDIFEVYEFLPKLSALVSDILIVLMILKMDILRHIYIVTPNISCLAWFVSELIERYLKCGGPL
jgi:hypothetical protein